jgi:nuclear pore complex protein Nup93
MPHSGPDAFLPQVIISTSILPLTPTPAPISIIRSHASALSSLPTPISRLAGPLLLWTIMAISRQREVLSGDTRQQMREELMLKAKDLMVFAGLVKLRLPKGVWEGIVMGAGEVGVY